jgi:hypothetical protein
VAAAIMLLAMPAADLYYQSSWGQGCARCHEIGIDYDSWHSSAHRKVNCVECHASSLATDLRRVAAHLKGEVPEQVHLGTDDVFAMVARCERCHRQEFAQWQAGPHAVTYAKIFTNPKQPLIDDCMRCHGMHFEGGIREVVQAVKGPALGNRPAIPCLACHSIHREGEPLAKNAREILRPSVGMFDRRARVHVSAANLPMPAMFEGTRAVRISPDQRQSLCYQCHAPLATRQVGSGDDRTPVGVHEGLSCRACHQKHGEASRQSCAECHPRLSNCGLDVEKMDTTFANPKSRHNVHWVKCGDCHVNGVPKKRGWGTGARGRGALG